MNSYTAGDIKQIPKVPGMCFISNEVTGMPRDGLSWLARVDSDGYSRAILAYDGTQQWLRYATGDLWTEWVKITTSTPPQEFALPLTSGLANFSDGDISRYWKNQFSEVTVAFALKSVGAVDVDQVIATLPVGYRPINPVRSAGVCVIGNVYSPFVVYIGTDGNINAGFLPGSSQYDGLFAEITFVSSP